MIFLKKKMIKFIAKIILFLILFGNLNAQNHLNRSNLITLCNCDPSFSIFITYKSIKTIDPTTFNGLSTLQFQTLCTLTPKKYKDWDNREIKSRLFRIQTEECNNKKERNLKEKKLVGELIRK